MTEEEARQKWCPFVRSGYGVNIPRSPDVSFHQCMGSGCMMWEWEEVGNYTTGKPHPNKYGDCGLKK